MTIVERLLALAESDERAVLFTVLDGQAAGAKLLALESGETIGDAPPELTARTGELLRLGRNRLLELDGRRVFCEIYGPPPRLLVHGAEAPEARRRVLCGLTYTRSSKRRST